MLVAANRLNNVKEYYFSQKLKEVRELVACGKPVINAGIGSQIYCRRKRLLMPSVGLLKNLMQINIRVI